MGKEKSALTTAPGKLEWNNPILLTLSQSVNRAAFFGNARATTRSSSFPDGQVLTTGRMPTGEYARNANVTIMSLTWAMASTGTSVTDIGSNGASGKTCPALGYGRKRMTLRDTNDEERR
jgi:hypothetical protein